MYTVEHCQGVLRMHETQTDNTGCPSLAARLHETLVHPRCGFVPRVNLSLGDADEPRLVAAMAAVGSSSGLRGALSGAGQTRHSVHGSGIGITQDEAIVPALAEAVERHAASTFYEEQFIWFAADAADCRVLDLDTIPRCSEREMENPHCSLSLPAKDKPIRWVQGICLHSGELVAVPAVMVYSHAGWRGPQERFWLPISTGCAAHGSYEDAVLTGICEVVERDAISLVWLQQLALPRICIDSVGPAAAPYWKLCLKGSADIEYHFFNATTDVGLPTIYGVQVSRYHPYARTIVACSTAFTFDQALAKVIKDLVSFKRTFLVERVLPQDVKSFTGLLDGATYMAKPEHASAFDFLLQSRQTVSFEQLSRKPSSITTLAGALQRLAALNMQVIAVDLTTDEAIRAGLRVVRVLIPELQPLSLHTAVQFLATPRLYSTPKVMGYEARDEANLNPWPQPFA